MNANARENLLCLCGSARANRCNVSSDTRQIAGFEVRVKGDFLRWIFIFVIG